MFPRGFGGYGSDIRCKAIDFLLCQLCEHFVTINGILSIDVNEDYKYKIIDFLKELNCPSLLLGIDLSVLGLGYPKH